MNKATIAILGSTSHIAKGLIDKLLQDHDFNLHLYTRGADRIHRFLDSIGKSADKSCVVHEGYNDFADCNYDVLINCVGVGTRNKLRGDYSAYFTVTEEFDNMSIGYLRRVRPDALYISFSSGAVYGREHSAPVEEDSQNHVKVNHIAAEDYYSIVRINAEAKHRAFNDLRIIDLRLFSYFSRFIDLMDGYFITDVLDCIVNKKVLETDDMNIVRDYVHPEDLFFIIRKCMDAGKINAAFDVLSANPVEKREILNYFSTEYGLQYKVIRTLNNISATGSKNIYCSRYNSALKIGYKPKYSSMDTIRMESQHLLNHKD